MDKSLSISSRWNLKILFLAAIVVPRSCQAFAQWQGPSIGLTTKRHATSLTGGTPKATEEADPQTCVKTVDILSLDSIRSTLIRQEETIIFALIERAQFRRNSIAYKKGGFGDLGIPIGSTPIEGDEKLSFLEYMLVGTEVLHCSVRRYTSPEEHAFFPERLPRQGHTHMDALPQLDYPQDLLSSSGGASGVNFNPILLQKYVDVIVPAITKEGDDEQHGSTILADIAVLQALSKRIHYGKFVAESKYRSDPEGYQRLVDAGDAEGVMKLLTNEKVEKKVLRRARLKAATYGREPLLAELPPIEQSESTSVVAAAAASAVVAALEALGEEKGQGGKVDPAVIEQIYEKIIIPMTKDVEVAYLFRRCGREPPPEYAPDRMSIDVNEL
jgi:chorismate mutase